MGEKNTASNINQLEELEETLSFCDLPLDGYQELIDDHHPSPNSPSHQLFEFPFIPNTTHFNNKNDIIFCGKLIKTQEFDDANGGGDDRSRYLFPLSSARLLNNNNNNNNNKKDLGSVSFAKRNPNSSSLIKSFRSQSYSSSSSSRRYKVLIGLAKVPQKMELSDIKKRQSRRNPSPMFPPPPVVSADLEVVSAGDGCRGGGGRRRGHPWSLWRPLRCIPHV
ncbi:hypothetical protein PTKIN_Ptkin16aG0473600 [Pterospermum kingtungense]